MALREKLQSAEDALSKPDMFELPAGLINIGLGAWLFVGAIAALMIVGAFVVLSAGITIPLILAAVIGAISFPLAEKLQTQGLSPVLAALGVLLFLLVVILITGWVAVAGIVGQWPELQASIQQGVNALAATASQYGLDGGQIHAAYDSGSASTSGVLTGFVSGLFASLASGLSGIFGLFFGIFIAVTLLYYILVDFANVTRWLGSHLGLPSDLGTGIVADGIISLRGYFRGTTLTGMAVAAVIGVGAFLLGVPLAVPIALVTFVTCYIPFFGAIFSGAFAFVIALGAQGLQQAVLLLVIVLIAQNVLQIVISARFMGDSLSLHPIVVLVVTMLGGTFGGLLGSALAAPMTALGVRAMARLRSYHARGLLPNPAVRSEAEHDAAVS